MKKKISKKGNLLPAILGGLLGLLLLVVAVTGYKLFSPQVTTLSTGSFEPANYARFPKLGQNNIASTSAKKVVTAPVSPSAPSSSTGVPILMYHYVGNNPDPTDRQRDTLSISPDRFEEQLSWLAANGYSPITLDTLYGLFSKKEIISKPIVLTFDDGYVDFYTTAFPILRKYNFRAVSFIITGLAGTSFYMSWGQIKEINSTGLVSFQAHTVNHPSLPALSYTDQLHQLTTSKNTLEQQLGTKVNFISYPYGSSDADTARAAQAAGFVGGVGTWYGKASGPGMSMPRIRIAGNISLGEFIQKVSN